MMEKTTEQRRKYENALYFGKKSPISCVLIMIAQCNYNASNGVIL